MKIYTRILTSTFLILTTSSLYGAGIDKSIYEASDRVGVFKDGKIKWAIGVLDIENRKPQQDKSAAIGEKDR